MDIVRSASPLPACTERRSIPKEIIDAARIDGAGHWQMLTHIMLPLARSLISTIAIFYFMWVWNDFIYPSGVYAG